jgi:Putative lumazine-binding
VVKPFDKFTSAINTKQVFFQMNLTESIRSGINLKIMKYSIIAFSLFISIAAAGQQPPAKNLQHMNNESADSAAISAVLNNAYFKGIYEGDIQLLGTVYYDHTLLFGDVKGQPYYKTLADYLDGVKNRQSPKDSGKPFKGEVLAIDVVNSIALAKVRVKMYDFNYFEFLSFHKIEGKWKIVNKMISDTEQ